MLICWAPGVQVDKQCPVDETPGTDSDACVAHIHVLPRSHAGKDAKTDTEPAPASGEPAAPVLQARTLGLPPAPAAPCSVTAACHERLSRAHGCAEGGHVHGAPGGGSASARLPAPDSIRLAQQPRNLASHGSA